MLFQLNRQPRWQPAVAASTPKDRGESVEWGPHMGSRARPWLRMRADACGHLLLCYVSRTVQMVHMVQWHRGGRGVTATCREPSHTAFRTLNLSNVHHTVYTLSQCTLL